MPPPARGCPTIGRAGVFGINSLFCLYYYFLSLQSFLPQHFMSFSMY